MNPVHQPEPYSLIVIGGGAAGITAARFAAQIGARVALVEKTRIGGDCTWTGCVPSKALLKVAQVAHDVREAGHYGIQAKTEPVDMVRVREYLHEAITAVHQHETPEILQEEGIDVFLDAACFLDAHTLQVGERTLTSKHFLVCTGASPLIPPIPGLRDVPFDTYLEFFDNDELPNRLLVIGAGPIGVEMAQAYQRLGSQVTLIDEALLPREEPEVAAALGAVFQREGVRFVPGLVHQACIRQEGIVLSVHNQEICGDRLLVAVGRHPHVTGLGLEAAGVRFSPAGIAVDDQLRTSQPHIYAAGDCTGGHQYTHYAGWQGFKAARNALLPHHSAGVADLVPRTTFTDPEVAHVGLTESAARNQFGDSVRTICWQNGHNDRAIAEGEQDGFMKIVHQQDGTLLGATIVSARAGEVIAEFTLAMKHGLKLTAVADAIHVYPTYTYPLQMMAAEVATADFLQSTMGRLLQRFVIK